ncbi:unnamed protein product [Orchesella dallaii]|uniref:C2H2-type domain-containing protein n=1 Tax=Orchesella dallaii TaxID=48710 RepID=A0ABP1PQT3_9HEXA
MSQGRAKKRKSGVSSGENLTFSSESEVSEPLMSEGPVKKRKRSSRSGVKKVADTKLTFSSESEVSNSVKIEGRGNNKKRSSRSGVKKVAATKLTFSSESEVSEPKMSEGQRNDKKRSSRRGVNKMADTKLTFSSENEVSNSVKIEGRGNNKKRSSRSGVKKVAATKLTFSSESEVSEPKMSEGQRNDKKRSSRRGVNKMADTKLTFSSENEVSNSVKIEGRGNNKKRSSRSGVKKVAATKLTFSSESEVSEPKMSEGQRNDKKRSSRRGVNKMADTKLTFSSENEVSNSVKIEGRGNNKKRSSRSGVKKVADTKLTFSSESEVSEPVPSNGQRNTMNDTPTHTTVRCTFPGCTINFKSIDSMRVHNRQTHKHLRCGVCSNIYNIKKFNNIHLKNNPTCAEVNPQPWDPVNKKEAQWILIRHDRDGKTTFGCKSGVFKNRKFQCPGCPMSFNSHRETQRHLNKIHRLVKCVVCNSITTIGKFNQTHKQKKLACGNVAPIPWITNEKDAEWFSPTCAQINPQPWDKENKKEAQWTVTRNVSGANTTFGMISAIYRKMEFQCTYHGCSMAFRYSTSLQIHVRLYHKHLKCGVCSEIHTIFSFNNKHLKNNLKCAEVNPQPWDKENKKKAEWILTRHDRRGKTTYGYKPGFFKYRKFQCKFPGCPMSFNNHRDALKHLNRHLRLVKCVVCSLITPLDAFASTHRRRKLSCGNVVPIPWVKNNQKDPDWFVERRKVRGQVFLCYKSKHGQVPESEADSDENITFGTESNVYINHFRIPQHLNRNSLNYMTCEVYGCSYHTTHSVVLRHHYKTHHSSLLTNWSVSFDAASKKIHQCLKPKCDQEYGYGASHGDPQDIQESIEICAHETNISSSANVSFQCPRENCKFKTSSQLVLARHENKHKQGLSARCLLCNEICSNTEKFLSHVRIRHKIHTNQLALYEDSNEHNGILNIYRCNIESCTGFMSGVKSFYEDHLLHHLDHTINTFSCGLCSLPLDTGKDLIAHFERSHNKADLAIKSVNIPTTLSCDLCPHLVFQSNAIFIIHNQFHHSERVTSVVDQVYPDFYKKCRRFKTFSTSTFSAEGEV